MCTSTIIQLPPILDWVYKHPPFFVEGGAIHKEYELLHPYQEPGDFSCIKMQFKEDNKKECQFRVEDSAKVLDGGRSLFSTRVTGTCSSLWGLMAGLQDCGSHGAVIQSRIRLPNVEEAHG